MRPVSLLARLEGRFELVLASLLLALLAPPFLPDGEVARYLLQILISLILLSGLLTVAERPRQLLVGLGLVIPALGLSWLARGLAAANLALAGSLFASAFFVFLGVLMLRYVLRAERVTTRILLAAVAVYLIMGFAWADWYATLEILRPGSISLAVPSGLAPYDAVHVTLSAALYYSFVTLTTLGYGDIAPLTEQARALAVTGALTGQLYLVVLIARLVAVHITHTGDS